MTVGRGARWGAGGQGRAHQISDVDTIDRRHLTRDQKIQVRRKIEDDLATIAAVRQIALAGTRKTTDLSDNCHKGNERERDPPSGHLS